MLNGCKMSSGANAGSAKWFVFRIFVAMVAPAAANAADHPLTWTLLGSDGTLSVRSVVAADAACPEAVADGTEIPLRPRAAAEPDFPVVVCETRVPATTSNLTIAGSPTPVLPQEVRRIVVLGDTGCRLEGRAVQDCNDPRAWPFAAIALRAASHRPDLVIHVGDYYYRETPCPAERAGCAGSPHGDSWTTWQADFFAPARPYCPPRRGFWCEATTSFVAAAVKGGVASSTRIPRRRLARRAPTPMRSV